MAKSWSGLPATYRKSTSAILSSKGRTKNEQNRILETEYQHIQESSWWWRICFWQRARPTTQVETWIVKWIGRYTKEKGFQIHVYLYIILLYNLLVTIWYYDNDLILYHYQYDKLPNQGYKLLLTFRNLEIKLSSTTSL